MRSPRIGGPEPEPVQTAVEHFAFFEAMAELVEQIERDGYRAEDAEHMQPYLELLAGLLTMRLVDRWVTGVTGGSPPTLRELQSARKAVRDVNAGPIRTALGGVLRALTDSWGAPSRHVGAHAFAYGQLLEDQLAVGMAADVQRSVIACAQASGDEELLPKVYLSLGNSYRIEGRLSEAERAFGRAGATANLVRDDYSALLSRHGLAYVVWQRGNLPRAGAMLDALVQDIEALMPRAPALRDVWCKAKHDRGNIMIVRGDFTRGIADVSNVLDVTTDPNIRGRLLNDLGYAFLMIGCRGAARNAYQLTLATTTERMIQVVVRMNLMDMAREDGEETVFERWRRELASESLPPHRETQFLVNTAEGLYRFGRRDAARDAIVRALVLAERHQYNEYLIKAEALQAEIEGGPWTPGTGAPATDARPASPAVAKVVDRLRLMRQCTTMTPCM